MVADKLTTPVPHLDPGVLLSTVGSVHEDPLQSSGFAHAEVVVSCAEPLVQAEVQTQKKSTI